MNNAFIHPLSGDMGIGTIAPVAKLHVEGNIHTSGLITASNIRVLGDYVILDTITSNTEQMVITNDGTGPALKVTQTGANSIAEFYDDGNSLAFKVANDGLIGIGTAAPQAKLHVVGSVKATASISSDTQFLGQASDTATAPSFSFTANPNTGIFQPAPSNLAVTTNGTERMRVLPNGNVGIGTTHPSEKLHVQGSILSSGSSSTGTQFLGIATDTVAAPSYSWTDDSNTGMYHPGADKLGLVTGGIERVSVLANGNVGIGTTDPSEKLHVTGNARVDGSASMTYTGTSTALTVNQQGTGKLFELQDAGTPRMTVLDGGYVGIGTSNPQQALHVVSDTRIDGGLTVGSTIASTDSIRSHCLPSDAMILIDANGIFPANQNHGSYAMIETVTATVPAITGSVPVTTQSPFADLYKEGSASFIGTAGNYITTSLTGYVPSSGLTIEAWVNYTTFTNADRTIGFHNPVGVGAAGNMSIGVNSSGVLILTYNASTVITPTANATLTLNTWNHIAFSYDGTTIRMFLNGVAATLTSVTLTTTIVGNLTLGQFNSLAASAYVANVRVVTGAAVYTAAFTVPAAPLGLAATGTTRFLLRAGQNVPTVQSGALVFDRGLKQFLNFGPQMFKLSIGFTAVFKMQWNGTSAGNYERVFEINSPQLTPSYANSIGFARANTSNQFYFYVIPVSGLGIQATTAYGGIMSQNTPYVVVCRYSATTGIAEIYVNGNNVASASGGLSFNDFVSTNTVIGVDASKSYWSSKNITCLTMYNRALTDTEIVNATTALLDTPVLPNNSTLEIGNLNSKPALSIAGDGRVNVQRLGQTSAVTPWPPAPMTGYVTVINGGTYVASASSEINSAYTAWKAFDKTIGGYWVTVPPTYSNTAPYGYIGTLKTTDINGMVYSGEWIQIQLPFQVTLSSYTISGQSVSTNPTSWVIVGSSDGQNWVTVTQQYSNAQFKISTGPFTFTAITNQPFSYWRLIVTNIDTGTAQYLQITEWTLYGTADTQQPLEIAQPTTMKYPLIAPQITGPQNAGVYVPQDFSSSALNIPAYVVGSVPGSSMGPFAGEGSLYFNGATTNYVSFPSSVSSLNYDIFASDFTIEMWVYNALNDGNQNTILNRTTPGNYGDWVIFQQGASINFGVNQVATYINQDINANVAARAPANQWYHLAVTMASSAIRIFVNGNTGSPSGTAKPTTSYTSSGSLNVGIWTYVSTGKFIGNITNIRIVRGAALYTSPFTPPTAPLQPIQGVTQAGRPYGTVLLLRNAPAPGRVLTQRFAGANSSSVLAFPPGPMTGYLTTINAGYGQGAYVASASSEFSGFFAWKPWLTGAWASAYGYNSSTPGNHTNNVTTLDVNGNTYIGEWLQIKVALSIKLSSYTWNGNNQQSPAKFWILGSLDEINWYLVDSRSGVNYNVTGATPIFDVSSSQAFLYFRIIINQIQNLVTIQPTAAVINNVRLNGTIESVNITADGRVGLGVVAPVQALEVAGNVVVNGTVSSQSMTFRNVLVNGDMRINQRGISTNTASPSAMGTSSTAYTVDRWLCIRGGYTAGGYVAQGFTAVTDLPYQNDGIVNFLRSGRNLNDTNTQVPTATNALETKDSYRLAGKTVTLSFYYRTGAGFSGSLLPYITTSTGVDQNWSSAWTGVLNTTPGALPISTSWTKYAFSAQISPTTKQVAVFFQHQATGTAVANDYYDITGVQLEKGTLATPFEVRPYGVELQMCQRYYESSYDLGVAPGSNTADGALFVYGSSDAGNNLQFIQRYIVPKRTPVVPTFYSTSGAVGSWNYARSGVGGTVTVTNYASTIYSWTAYVNVGAAYVACNLYGNWAASAEL